LHRHLEKGKETLLRTGTRASLISPPLGLASHQEGKWTQYQNTALPQVRRGRSTCVSMFLLESDSPRGPLFSKGQLRNPVSPGGQVETIPEMVPSILAITL
ncbi:unnamed protein product, partial [Gulo gulo]